jgi:hypothetical protein
MNKIALDLSNMLCKSLGKTNGVTEEELGHFEKRIKNVLVRVKEERAQGRLAFMDLPCMGGRKK